MSLPGLFKSIHGYIKSEMPHPFPAFAAVDIDLQRLHKLLLQRAEGYI